MAGQRLRLEVTRLSPRKLDRTNLAGGSIKGIEDMLVRRGFLRDDSEQWLQGPFLRQEIASKPSTVIRLMLISPEHGEAF
jgi:hypothetical protein